MEPADVVLRFLESVGKKAESDFYLALFRADSKERFAAISVDANVARHAWEAVVLDLRFLAALGLFPLVVLGLFEPTDALEHGARIHRRLTRSGVTNELIAVEPGRPMAQLAEELTQLLRSGRLPIVAFGPDNLALTVEERFVRLAALLTGLSTRKLIFLHRPGGIRQGGALVPLVNLTSDYAQLVASKELSRKERAILVEARRLVDGQVPHKLLVSITSPLNLFRELFTTKGAGTMLRRGAALQRFDGWSGVDRARMRGLLESAFGRPPTEHFFERPVQRVYVEESYRGAAILVDTPLGAYLTKFAVDREAQGEGIGRDLWERLWTDSPTVFWRARLENPINAWYTQLCDGLLRLPGWIVFWKGLPAAQIPAAVEYAIGQPVDIPPAGE